MQQQQQMRRRSLDSEEFVGLVLAHESGIRAFVTSLMLPSSDVDDVFQNACMAAFRKLATFRYSGESPDAEFVRWVCTIARYEVLLYYRSRRTTRVAFSSELVTQLADMQIEEAHRMQDRSEALQECIGRLSDREQLLIRMRYGQETPVAEIAQRIGRTANGVYKALERIRARLMACIRMKLNTQG